jgi:hypothetical protein
LAEENRELREALASVLFWIACRRDLLALAREEIERRFGEER